MHCTAGYNLNIILAGDWNKDLNIESQFSNTLNERLLKVIPNNPSYTYERSGKKSNLDFFVLSAHIDSDIETTTETTPSDHRCCTLKVNDDKEINRMTIKILKRKAAKNYMLDALDLYGHKLNKFLSYHKNAMSKAKNKEITLKKNNKSKAEQIDLGSRHSEQIFKISGG